MPEDMEERFRAIFRHYRPKLLAFFSRRGFNIETCHELSQETFLRVYRSMDTYRREVPWASWIFQIAANVYRNELRQRHAEKRSGREDSLDDYTETDLDDLHPAQGAGSSAAKGPLDQAMLNERAQALRRALFELPPKMRRVVQMRLFQGREVAEIATLMNISESTVKVHLFQARKRLKQLLADRFDELEI